MKFKRDKYDKHWYFHINKNAFVHSINDYEQLFGKWNWYSFNFFKLYIMKDDFAPGFEFEFAVLGLGFRLRVNRSWKGTELAKRIKESKKDIKAGRFKTVKQIKRSLKLK